MDKEQTYYRFQQSIDYLKDNGKIHKQQDIAVAIGVSKSYMSDVMKDRGGKFSEDFLHRFATAYSDYINEDWLLTGEGQMAKPLRELRPHIQAKAAAGFMSGISEGEYGDNMRPMIPGIPDYDFSITAYGKSMEPRIEDNDILACRIVTDSLNPPVGKICVIDSKDGAAVKVIRDVEEDCLVLHSLNPEYRDYRVNFSDLNQIAVVVGSVRNY